MSATLRPLPTDLTPEMQEALKIARDNHEKDIAFEDGLNHPFRVVKQEVKVCLADAFEFVYHGTPLPGSAPEADERADAFQALTQPSAKTVPAESIVPSPDAESETDELTDEQLVQMAVEYLMQGTSSEKAVKKLLNEVDGITQLDAERFVRLALEQRLEEEQVDADESRKVAGDAVDKAKEAEAESNRNWLENYALKNRKRMPVTEEEIQKAARLLKLEAERAARVDLPDLTKADYPEFPDWVFEGTSFYENHVKPICEANPGARVPHFNFIPGVVVMLNYLGTKVRINLRSYPLSSYVVLIGRKGKVKKTSSINDAVRYMQFAGIVGHYSRNVQNADGKSVIWEAGSSEGLGTDMQRITCKNAILYYDELSVLAKKCNIESSTLRETLLRGYESAKFGNSIKSKKDAFSIEPGTYVLSLLSSCTKKKFAETYALLGSGEDGLDDRFTFHLQPEVLERSRPQHYVDTQKGAEITRKLIDKAVNQQAYEIKDTEGLLDKALAEGMDDRSEIRAEKYALYFAIDLGRDLIDSECIARGLAIVRYELAVKDYLKLVEADSKQAVLEIKIRRLLEDAPQGTLSTRELERKANAHRYGTFNWRNAINGLLQAGVIRQVTHQVSWGRKDSVSYQVLRALEVDEDDE